jgi:hypothetical protein
MEYTLSLRSESNNQRINRVCYVIFATETGHKYDHKFCVDFCFGLQEEYRIRLFKHI